jgi:hypothetical protein
MAAFRSRPLAASLDSAIMTHEHEGGHDLLKSRQFERSTHKAGRSVDCDGRRWQFQTGTRATFTTGASEGSPYIGSKLLHASVNDFPEIENFETHARGRQQHGAISVHMATGAFQ